MSRPRDARDRGAGAERIRPPGERPFTDFGQWGYGHLDLRVFDTFNDTFWVDITGRPHRIVEMTPDYRLNVLRFLEHNAAYFHLMTILRRLLEVISDLESGAVDERDLRRLQWLLELGPVDWITGTSVARALGNALDLHRTAPPADWPTTAGTGHPDP